MKLPRLYAPEVQDVTGSQEKSNVTTTGSVPVTSPVLPHAADLKSGTAVAVASHITTQQKIIDWVERMPATLENAATRLKAEEQLAVTWYAGHKVLAYCIVSFATGLAAALILFNL